VTAGQWVSLGTPVSSTNKTGRHYIAEILLKVALNTIVPHHLIIDFQHLSDIIFQFRQQFFFYHVFQNI
jgi:hypothetical protein